ncbi:MAG TPA: hypothetical protein VH255_09755 [Verrucomicrobiae bacterium]|jgi:hypothetical protein|nr:hypothetical protein [Verrucomicrobiae bacterium]
MTQHKNPSWWNQENDNAWGRVKAAFQRDWDQTKHDMGSDEPDTDQNASDTVKQATGTQTIPDRGEPTFDKAEPAYRFGYGARSHYGKKYETWNDEVENELKRDWMTTNPDADWDEDSENIRSGWDFEE